MVRTVNKNILSERYATEEMNKIYSELGRARLERQFWLRILKSQSDYGVEIPDDAITAYENAVDDIDFDRIREIEEKTRHDVKARIQAYNEAAGGKYELIHLGMTSRDMTDNVEQIQILRAASIILRKYVSILRHFRDWAEEYKDRLIVARTHNQPAQVTTLGRKFAMYMEELIPAFQDYEKFIRNYPMRGIKGAVGTQADQLTLLGDEEAVELLELEAVDKFGFGGLLEAPGQVYPRSLDYRLASLLSSLSSACESFAKDMRLMAGRELVTEGFKEGQVGSSAMPHKMNTRSSERICAFSELLKMYVDGASRLSGVQWEEGDVSCSVVRRVILPNMFYVSDGLCETTLTVLNEMGIYPAVIDAELKKYMPFMASATLLNKAVEEGLGREEAHAIIKRHAVPAALNMRKSGRPENNFIESLAGDVEFPLNTNGIREIVSEPEKLIGLAANQTDRVVEKANEIILEYPSAATYEPEEIL